MGLHRAAALRQLQERHPSGLAGPQSRYGPSLRVRGEPARLGEYWDAWGSRRRVAQRGAEGLPELGAHVALPFGEVWQVILGTERVERFCTGVQDRLRQTREALE